MTKRAVVLEPEEKRALGLLQQIQAVSRQKEAKRKDKQAERRQEKVSTELDTYLCSTFFVSDRCSLTSSQAKKNAAGDQLKAEREKRERKEHASFHIHFLFSSVHIGSIR